MATRLSLLFFSKFEKPICRSGDCYSVLKPSASTLAWVRSGMRYGPRLQGLGQPLISCRLWRRRLVSPLALFSFP